MRRGSKLLPGCVDDWQEPLLLLLYCQNAEVHMRRIYSKRFFHRFGCSVYVFGCMALNSRVSHTLFVRLRSLSELNASFD